MVAGPGLITVHNVPEYIEAVLSQARQWGVRRVWYRGQPSKAWQLLPTAYREGGFVGGAESDAFNVFWARGRGLRDFAHLHPEHEWDWYFAARHHGMPTRLLDWSSSPLVALYFALIDASTSAGGRVWLLDPCSMNDASCGDDCLLVPSHGDAEFVSSWLPKNVISGKMSVDDDGVDNWRPLAIYPSHTNARIIAQQGCFTVHGADTSPLEAQWDAWHRERGVQVRYAAIDIEIDDVSHLSAQLEQLGMNAFLLFPDGDHLARHVAAFYASQR